MSLLQLLLIACVAELALEAGHMLWVIARDNRLVFFKDSYGTGVCCESDEVPQGRWTTSRPLKRHPLASSRKPEVRS
jgi:hypothetical protein